LGGLLLSEEAAPKGADQMRERGEGHTEQGQGKTVEGTGKKDRKARMQGPVL
jgi:hypothetical protein